MLTTNTDRPGSRDGDSEGLMVCSFVPLYIYISWAPSIHGIINMTWLIPSLHGDNGNNVVYWCKSIRKQGQVLGINQLPEKWNGAKPQN